MCVTTTAALILQLAPLPSAAAGCTYIGGCGYRAPTARRRGAVSVRCGRAPAENRPGSPAATSRRGERQPLKLTRYRSNVGGMATPHGVTLYSRPRPGAPSEHRGPADRVTVPAPGRQRGRARFKGPPMLPSPHQITSAMTATLARSVPKTGQKTGQIDLFSLEKVRKKQGFKILSEKNDT